MAGKLPFLPFMLTFSAGLTVLAAIVGAVLRGGSGALGAAAGVALMVTLFVLSTVVIVWVETINRQMMLPAVFMTYMLKLCVLLAVLNAVMATGWSGMRPMLIGVVAGIVGWVGAYAWWLWRAKIPYVEID